MSANYQVIARKWRPQVFEDVVGQDHIVRTLKNAIEGDRIAHAYLFVGPRGTGKTSLARIFAKALNCATGVTATPCNACPSCETITAGNSMDVIEVDGASNNSVDQIRDLRDDVRYAPTQGKYKIYIIDEVHMLSNQAFNALLKTLEEPPSHVKFVFATTESQKVLPTIVSRCQRFELKPIADSLIAERLGSIAGEEGVDIEPEALSAIARLAFGGMRDSQSILDQMISFCGKKISARDVQEVYGILSEEQVRALAAHLVAGDYRGLVDAVDAMADEGRDLFRALVDLQAFLREALVAAVRGEDRLGPGGAKGSPERLTRILEVLRDGREKVMHGLSDRINFEIVLLKAAEEGQTRAIDTVVRELAELASALPAEEPAEKKKPQVSLSATP